MKMKERGEYKSPGGPELLYLMQRGKHLTRKQWIQWQCVTSVTKQKQTHRYRKQTDGYSMGGGWGVGDKGEQIKICKLPVIKTVMGM